MVALCLAVAAGGAGGYLPALAVSTAPADTTPADELNCADYAQSVPSQSPWSLTVQALYFTGPGASAGNAHAVDPGYTGTVTLQANLGRTLLSLDGGRTFTVDISQSPYHYPFTASDAGSHTFLLEFLNSGTPTVAVNGPVTYNPLDPTATGSCGASTQVLPGPHLQLSPTGLTYVAGGAVSVVAELVNANGSAAGPDPSPNLLLTAYTVSGTVAFHCPSSVCSLSAPGTFSIAYTRAGSYALSATDGSKSTGNLGGASLSVHAGALYSLGITPATASTNADPDGDGASHFVGFTAAGLDRFGNARPGDDETSAAAWSYNPISPPSSSGGMCTVAGAGSVNGGAQAICATGSAGSYAVTAVVPAAAGTQCPCTGSAAWTVSHGRQTGLTVSAAELDGGTISADVSATTGLVLSATANDAEQNVWDETADSTFYYQEYAPGVPSVPTPCDAGRVCHLRQAASYQIFATDTTPAGATLVAPPLSVTVKPGRIASLALTPAWNQMTAGQTLQYTAYPADAEGNDLLGTDMFGNPMPDASATYAYSGTDTRGNALGPVACPAGLCGGTDPKTGSTHAGDFHVVATDSALARASAPSFLQIRAGAPTQLALQPAKAQIASGSSVAYLVYDEDQYGNPILGTGGTPAPDIHEKVAFSGPTSGTCALDTHTGTYGCSPTKAGTYAIAASSSVPPPVGLTPAGAQLTVLPGGLWTVVIQPGSTNAAVGQGVSYTTLGYDQNNNLIGNITGSTRFTFAPTSAGTCVSPAGQPAVPGNDLCTANQAGTFYVVGAATLDNVTRSATAILKAS